MTSPNTPPGHPSATHGNVIPLRPPHADDQTLQALLRQALQAPADATSRALMQRVMADWHRRPPHPEKTPSSWWSRLDSPAAPNGPGRPRGMAWAAWPAWVGAACLVAGVTMAYTLWLHQSRDAAIDELSQIDVLSQMAAGEM